MASAIKTGIQNPPHQARTPSSAEKLSQKTTELQNGQLRAFNLTALEVWKTYTQETEKGEMDRAKGIVGQGAAFVDSLVRKDGKTHYEDIQDKWAREREFVGLIEKRIKKSGALTIREALGQIKEDPSLSKTLRDKANFYLQHGNRGQRGQFLGHLIDFTAEQSPDTKSAQELMNEAFAFETDNGAAETPLAVYSLVTSTTKDPAIQEASLNHMKSLTGDASWGRSLFKFVASGSPEGLAHSVLTMHAAAFAGNIAQLRNLKGLENLGIGGAQAVVRSRVVGAASEGLTLGTLNIASEAVGHDTSHVSSLENAAKSYTSTLLMIGALKTFTLAGSQLGPAGARSLGLVKEGGATLSQGGKAVTATVQHTTGLAGGVAATTANQALGLQETPHGGATESIVHDIANYVLFAVAHKTADRLCGGKMTAVNGKLHNEIALREKALTAEHLLSRFEPRGEPFSKEQKTEQAALLSIASLGSPGFSMHQLTVMMRNKQWGKANRYLYDHGLKMRATPRGLEATDGKPFQGLLDGRSQGPAKPEPLRAEPVIEVNEQDILSREPVIDRDIENFIETYSPESRARRSLKVLSHLEGPEGQTAHQQDTLLSELEEKVGALSRTRNPGARANLIDEINGFQSRLDPTLPTNKPVQGSDTARPFRDLATAGGPKKPDLEMEIPRGMTGPAFSPLQPRELAALRHHRNAWKVSRAILENVPMSPRTKLRVGDQTFYFGPIVRSGNQSLHTMALVNENGTLKMRHFRKSGSGGGWKLVPFISQGPKGLQSHKGIHYTAATEPVREIQDFLSRAENEPQQIVELSEREVNDYIVAGGRHHLDQNQQLISHVFYEIVLGFDNTLTKADTPELVDIQKFQPGEAFKRTSPSQDGKDVLKAISQLSYPEGFVPDFSKKPLTTTTRNHSLLGQVRFMEHEGVLNGRKIIWTMAEQIPDQKEIPDRTDGKTRVWIQSIRFADAKVNSYGVSGEMIDSGILTSKPLEYRSQSTLLPGLPSFGDSYVDMTPALDVMKPIRNFQKAIQQNAPKKLPKPISLTPPRRMAQTPLPKPSRVAVAASSSHTGTPQRLTRPKPSDYRMTPSARLSEAQSTVRKERLLETADNTFLARIDRDGIRRTVGISETDYQEACRAFDESGASPQKPNESSIFVGGYDSFAEARAVTMALMEMYPRFESNIVRSPTRPGRFVVNLGKIGAVPFSPATPPIYHTHPIAAYPFRPDALGKAMKPVEPVWALVAGELDRSGAERWLKENWVHTANTRGGRTYDGISWFLGKQPNLETRPDQKQNTVWRFLAREQTPDGKSTDYDAVVIGLGDMNHQSQLIIPTSSLQGEGFGGLIAGVLTAVSHQGGYGQMSVPVALEFHDKSVKIRLPKERLRQQHSPSDLPMKTLSETTRNTDALMDYGVELPLAWITNAPHEPI